MDEKFLLFKTEQDGEYEMESIIEHKIGEMNSYLVEEKIEGCCEWDKTLGEIYLKVKDILYSQIREFENKFNVFFCENIGSNEVVFITELDYTFLEDSFQTEVTQEDCKGDGIKLYRRYDNTFPSKTHSNNYLGVFETKGQVNAVIQCYANELLSGKHEDLVFQLVKHERVKQIKDEF